MILRILSLLLTPLDYAAAAYLVARGVMLAPDTDPPQWLRDFERAPRRKVCDGCLCDLGSCASWRPRSQPHATSCPNGCACRQCDAGDCALCERSHGCAPTPVTCDGCGASMGEDCAPTCRFVVPPPVVACCYCGKPAVSGRSFPDRDSLSAARVPICDGCMCNHGVTLEMIWTKLAADRAQTAVAARAEEAGGLWKVPDLDAEKALPRCGMPACPIPGCQR